MASYTVVADAVSPTLTTCFLRLPYCLHKVLPRRRSRKFPGLLCCFCRLLCCIRNLLLRHNVLRNDALTNITPAYTDIAEDWANDYYILRPIAGSRGYNVCVDTRLCELPCVYCDTNCRCHAPMYARRLLNADRGGKEYQLNMKVPGKRKPAIFDPAITKCAAQRPSWRPWHHARRVGEAERPGPSCPGCSCSMRHGTLSQADTCAVCAKQDGEGFGCSDCASWFCGGCISDDAEMPCLESTATSCSAAEQADTHR